MLFEFRLFFLSLLQKKTMPNRHGSHSVHNLQVHLVWITKYRYQVLQGDIQLRCREIIRQSYNSLDIRILELVIIYRNIDFVILSNRQLYC